MQVTKSLDGATKVNLRIKADSRDLEPVKHHVLGHFVRRVKVPGFRQGKAPFNMIEKHVDQKAFLGEFMEHAINDLYGKALEQEKVRPISRPAVQLKKFVPFLELEFEVAVETLGKIKLPDYKRIKLDKPKSSVDAKEVNEVMQSLVKRSAERKEIERSAKKGDELIIDFSSKDDRGQPVVSAEGKDYPLLLGSNSFIPGFEDNLVGLKSGENKEFKISFPEDYGVPALRNKEVTFSVAVIKVNELDEPKIDDAFAAKVGPFKNLAGLKSDIKKQLLTEKQQQSQREFESKLIQEISERSEMELPQSMVEEQLMQMEEEEKRNLTYRGQTWQEHLVSEGVSEQQHRERHRPDAAARVKAGLVLSEIAKEEGIELTPQELKLRLQILKGQYQDPAMQAELDKPEHRQDIASRLLTEKTIQRLVDYASK